MMRLDWCKVPDCGNYRVYCRGVYRLHLTLTTAEATRSTRIRRKRDYGNAETTALKGPVLFWHPVWPVLADNVMMFDTPWPSNSAHVVHVDPVSSILGSQWHAILRSASLSRSLCPPALPPRGLSSATRDSSAQTRFLSGT